MGGAETGSQGTGTAGKDPLTREGILACLPPAGRFLADRIQIHSTLVSTNRTAKDMARAGAVHGTSVFADRQTAGRGRLNRSFSSPAGGLYMSVILDPAELPFRSVSFVTPFAGVIVCEAIEEVTGKTPGIKWVNDLMLNGKKICGILTEAVSGTDSSKVDRVIVGIGINTHAREEDFPPDVRHIAGSIDPDQLFPDLRNRLAASILNRMLEAGPALSQESILERYRKRLIMLEKEITVIQGDRTWQAKATDLDSDCRLIVQDGNGETVSLDSGEIRIRI